MQTLSASNLQSFEIDETDRYGNNRNNRKQFSGRKFNFESIKKLMRYDSAYGSSASVENETVFFIDSARTYERMASPDNDIIRGSEKRSYSSNLLYDKRIYDEHQIFGSGFENPFDFSPNQSRSLNYFSLNNNNNNNSDYNNNDVSEVIYKPAKFESRSWDEIHKLSNTALKIWENYSKNSNKTVINSALKNSYDYVEPNLNAKNCVFLNSNLLQLPLRRFTSEINMHKMHINRAMFSDDTQTDFIGDTSFSKDSDTKSNKSSSTVFRNVSEEILQLVLDMQQFQSSTTVIAVSSSDQFARKVSEKLMEIDSYLLSQLSPSDVANYLFSKHICGCKLTSICTVFGFSQAFTQIIVDVIRGKSTVTERVNCMIAFIKVAINTYQMANWQSLKTVLNALHSFTIYRMNNEWMRIKANNKTLFEQFVRLSGLTRSGEASILVSHPRGYSDIRNTLVTMQIDCCAKWDRMEKPVKWLIQPGIIEWLNTELNHFRASSHKYFKSHDSDTKTSHNNSCNNNKSNDNNNHRICVIRLSELPKNWSQRSVKNIPLEFQSEINKYLFNCLLKK